MNTYHIIVEPAEDGWLAAQALENQAIVTQGRTLDEVVFMVRDAIELLTGEKEAQVELIVPSQVRTQTSRRRRFRKSTLKV